MAYHFFSQPSQAYTRDIANTEYPDEIKAISNKITEEEIEQVTGSLPNNKAQGPDGIPNRVLKHCRKTPRKILTVLFNACLAIGYHVREFKDSTTIVLRKHQKPNYDTPKAYRPIEFLNTISKLLEKLVANRLSKAAESYNLFLEEQMGARK